MKTIKKVLYTAVVLVIAAAAVSCSNIFSARETSDSSSGETVLSLNLSGVTGSSSARTAISLTGYTVAADIYSSTGTLLTSATGTLDSTSSSTLSFTGLTPKQSVYAVVKLSTAAGETLYKRTSDTITLAEGTNTIAFASSTTPVILYDMTATTPTINYTTTYTSTAGLTMTGTPTEIIGTDFDAEGNAYVLYKNSTTVDSTTTYTFYIDKITAAGTVTNIYTATGTVDSSTDVASTFTFAIDRTAGYLYLISGTEHTGYTGTTDGSPRYNSAVIKKYTLSGSLITSYTNSVNTDYNTFYDIYLAASNGTLYMYFSKSDTSYIVKPVLTESDSSWTADYKLTLGSTLTDSTTFSYSTDYNIVQKQTSYAAATTYMKVTDMKYYNGYLWLLLNQNYYADVSGYSQYCYSRGGLLQLSDFTTTKTVTVTNSDMDLTLFGWTNDSGYNGYRPGASEGSKDTTSTTSLYGPRHIIALSPKKLYIADDGMYVSGHQYNSEQSQHAYGLSQKNSITGFSLSDDSIDMSAASVEFDNNQTYTNGSGSNYYTTSSVE